MDLITESLTFVALAGILAALVWKGKLRTPPASRPAKRTEPQNPA